MVVGKEDKRRMSYLVPELFIERGRLLFRSFGFVVVLSSAIVFFLQFFNGFCCGSQGRGPKPKKLVSRRRMKQLGDDRHHLDKNNDKEK